MEKPAAPRAGSGRRSRGCPEHSEGHVCLMLICWHLPAAAFPRSRRSRAMPGSGSSWGAGLLPLGTCPRRSPGWGGHGRVRSFLNQKEANPHVPVCASCWD